MLLVTTLRLQEGSGQGNCYLWALNCYMRPFSGENEYNTNIHTKYNYVKGHLRLKENYKVDTS